MSEEAKNYIDLASVLKAMQDNSDRILRAMQQGSTSDHDLLISLNTKFDTFIVHTVKDMDNSINEIKVEMKDRARASEVHALETRVASCENRVKTIEDGRSIDASRKNGVKDFLGMTWQAWLFLSGIIALGVTILK